MLLCRLSISALSHGMVAALKALHVGVQCGQLCKLHVNVHSYIQTCVHSFHQHSNMHVLCALQPQLCQSLANCMCTAALSKVK